MLVEQSQLLAAVRRVERDVDIVRDAFGNLPARCDHQPKRMSASGA
jgi:hypothetical protein